MPLRGFRTRILTVHAGRLTWNLQIAHLERKMIFQTSMIMFHVTLQGCKFFSSKNAAGFLDLTFPFGHQPHRCCGAEQPLSCTKRGGSQHHDAEGRRMWKGGQGKKACVCVFFFLGGGGGLNSLVFGEVFWFCSLFWNWCLLNFVCFFWWWNFMMTINDNHWWPAFYALRLVPSAPRLGGWLVRSVMDLLVLYGCCGFLWGGCRAHSM